MSATYTLVEVGAARYRGGRVDRGPFLVHVLRDGAARTLCGRIERLACLEAREDHTEPTCKLCAAAREGA